MAQKSQWKMVDYRLAEAQIAEALAKYALTTAEDIVHVLTAITAHGYKISLTWVDASEAFCVTVTGTDWAKHNQSTSMSTWSDDLPEAIAMTYFKLNDTFNWSKWPDTGSKPKNYG